MDGLHPDDDPPRLRRHHNATDPLLIGRTERWGVAASAAGLLLGRR